MTAQLCDPLKGGWPFQPHCLNCKADIRTGERYAIVTTPRGALSVVCARPACSGQPLPAAERAPQRPRPATDRPRAGRSVLDGRWSKLHERCQECGTTERKHADHGLCTRCSSRTRDRRRKAARRAAKRLQEAPAVAVPAETVHSPRCPCFACSERRSEAGTRSTARDWRGMPFSEAAG